VVGGRRWTGSGSGSAEAALEAAQAVAAVAAQEVEVEVAVEEAVGAACGRAVAGKRDDHPGAARRHAGLAATKIFTLTDTLGRVPLGTRAGPGGGGG